MSASDASLHAIDLVLASTSRYRRELLGRIVSDFRVDAPHVDESAFDGETAAQLAARLAAAKADVVAARNPGAVIIGSDQVAECEGKIFGKPGDAEHAREQLRAASGRDVVFHSAVCVRDGRTQPAREFSGTDTTTVTFRCIGADEIERYVGREPAFDCAGSFKAEGLGIALFENVHSDDPTALIGLPLIALSRLLRAAGVPVI